MQYQLRLCHAQAEGEWIEHIKTCKASKVCPKSFIATKWPFSQFRCVGYRWSCWLDYFELQAKLGLTFSEVGSNFKQFELNFEWSWTHIAKELKVLCTEKWAITTYCTFKCAIRYLKYSFPHIWLYMPATGITQHCHWLPQGHALEVNSQPPWSSIQFMIYLCPAHILTYVKWQKRNGIWRQDSSSAS